MRLQQLVLIVFSFLALAAAQPRCDPITEYEDKGECCKRCGPGTHMSPLGSCLTPACQPCESGEYQDKYTKDVTCSRQQSCDPNKNFADPKHDPTKRTTCVCKEGFHCSSDECITCVPHTSCKPGHGVRSEGSHSKDTVCEKCSKGTFSQNNSQTEACRKWTECPSGQTLLQPGTAASDSVCGGQSRSRMTLIIVVVVFSVLFLVCLIAYLVFGKRRGSDRNSDSESFIYPRGAIKVQRCLQLCLGERGAPPRENNPLVPDPNDTADSSISKRQMSLVEPRTPEEVDDDLSQEITIATEVHLTDKGKFVMQDKGITLEV